MSLLVPQIVTRRITRFYKNVKRPEEFTLGSKRHNNLTNNDFRMYVNNDLKCVFVAHHEQKLVHVAQTVYIMVLVCDMIV